METIVYRPIGVIRSPFEDAKGVPIQPSGAAGVVGRVEVAEPYVEGLKDVEGFSHVILLYHFHLSAPWKPLVVPFLDTVERGVFSTRAPARPNPIGFSVVELVGREGGVLHVRGVDVVDGTPLLDIKPYVPAFDRPSECRAGWLEGAGKRVERVRSDDRFLKE
ncbi:tRNA-Thr(GGU) m(6)t(6)A37 methyltransferase TsaA [Desulfacinum hydrothermale DSM 13146]|uniref:tRNA-Thr(GGU) m(6)t(6)A37 methyltransferase TsaA n=1 Tax=Desulfacinum hydrothermale DSM 13146 TaxID=1121390 RepID=A0A1W1XBR8_9BACT|nr:tRNA (N6-threonylcarbamoyladenosine(37)-N6)-methyltransferase TrmO [Desulfacinum hydrothermale]SMC21313.1 tRNA-Thr(GGU) m(6)t(6)A37 methyltransferase TsaA [Desulfacinum hydrothermale DSM 13146]